VESEYLDSLSAPSRLSLQLQGGPMSDAEIAEFRGNLHYEAALRLRRWDDMAKTPGLVTPPIEYFASHVERASRNRITESEG
jgi:[1-hydroxy-2-(trimethylamino)ethyl]phosphonate dioxygenase